MTGVYVIVLMLVILCGRISSPESQFAPASILDSGAVSRTEQIELKRRWLTMVPLAIPGRRQGFILSAFYDTRFLLYGQEPRIQVLSAVRNWTQAHPKVHCLIGLAEDSGIRMLLEIPAVIEQSCLNNIMFKECLISCPIEFSEHLKTFSVLDASKLWVTIAATRTRVLRWIRIEIMPGFPYPPLNGDEILERTDRVDICTAPLTGSVVGKEIDFAGWVEFHRMMAGDLRVMIYNESGVPSDVLLRYESQGIVDNVIWVPPTETTRWNEAVRRVSLETDANGVIATQPSRLSKRVLNELVFDGKILTAQDCVFRSAGRAHWLAFIDINEYLLPKKHPTWMDMLKHAGTEELAGYAYRFHSVFHFPPCNGVDLSASFDAQRLAYSCLDLNDCLRQYQSEPSCTYNNLPWMLEAVFRDRRSWPFQRRRKLIVDPTIFLSIIGDTEVTRLKPAEQEILEWYDRYLPEEARTTIKDLFWGAAGNQTSLFHIRDVSPTVAMVHYTTTRSEGNQIRCHDLREQRRPYRFPLMDFNVNARFGRELLLRLNEPCT